jgi:DNA modification methylase
MTDDAIIYNEDSIAGLAQRVPDNTIHLTVTSIPFEELFTYSGKLEDVGNNGSTVNLREGRFALNLRFWIEQMFRVTRPGCNCCIHIQQLLAYKNQHGFIGRRDFRGALVDLMSAHGWDWKGEFAICKNPQAMAQRLSLHSLMFITGKRNARNLVSAPNDFALVFQKPGEAEPVPAIYDPVENPKGWLTTDEWIRDAHGVWTDIDEFDLLGSAACSLHIEDKSGFKGARTAKETDEEKHVCPLQISVIRRCVRLYTNPLDLVLDPFVGIGSTACVAMEQGRRAIGFELKESYFREAVYNTQLMRERLRSKGGLFDYAAQRELQT